MLTAITGDTFDSMYLSPYHGVNGQPAGQMPALASDPQDLYTPGGSEESLSIYSARDFGGVNFFQGSKPKHVHAGINREHHDVESQTLVPVDYAWKNGKLKNAIDTFNRLDLNRVTTQMIGEMSAQEVASLSRHLENHKVGAEQYSGQVYRTRNAVDVLAERMWATGDMSAFSRIYATSPNTRAWARSDAFKSGEVDAIEQMGRPEIVGLMTADLSSKPGGLNDIDKTVLRDAMKASVANKVGFSDILKGMSDNGVEPTPKNLGAITGTYMAALKAYSDEHRPDDGGAGIMSDSLSVAGIVKSLPGPWGALAGAVGLAASKSVEGSMSEQQQHDRRGAFDVKAIRQRAQDIAEELYRGKKDGLALYRAFEKEFEKTYDYFQQ